MNSTLDPAKLLEFARLEAEYGEVLKETLSKCECGTDRKISIYHFVVKKLGREAVFSAGVLRLVTEYIFWRDDYLKRNFGCE